MTNKKLIQIIVICVVAVWVFSITFMIGVIRVRKQNELLTASSPLGTSNSYSDQYFSQSTPAQSTDAPTYDTQPTTAQSEPSQSVQQSEPTQNADSTTQSNVPSSKSDIVQAYVQAVNKLKSEPNFSLVKSELLHVSIVEMTPASAMNMANKMIQSNEQEAPEAYKFVNGFDADSGMSPTNVIAPLGINAALSDSVVKSAAATPNSDGGFTLKLTLSSEVQTLDSPAPNYSTSMQVIKLESLGLPSSAKFDSLSITYDDSTIEAIIDSDGRIKAMKHFLNVSDAEGSGSMVFPINAKLNGNFTTTYEIAY